MRLALTQLDLAVGDLDGNVDRLASAYQQAVDAGADLVVAPELAVTGYPPEDLLRKPDFVAATGEALQALAARIGDVMLVVGTVEDLRDGPDVARPVVANPDQPPLANAAAVLADGVVQQLYRKQLLPNYGVFDEARYFHAGVEPLVIDVAGVVVGVTVCEDLWASDGPAAAACAAGARVLVNLNASPYHRGKRSEREAWARQHAARHDVTVAYVNEVGGQDEIVFDGDSFVLDRGGRVVARGAQFAEAIVVADVASDGTATGTGPVTAPLDPLEEVWQALVIGTRDYTRSNGFPGALVGVSGGIDSALTGAVAVDALGSEAVTFVAMPSPHSSQGSIDDARALAKSCGVELLELPITPMMEAFETVLAEPLTGYDASVALENLQSRIRGTILMSLSNARGDLLLTTGNKSEYAVGYATLYGDMAGGFAVLKDVPKLLVYELARHCNDRAGREVIPTSSIEKPPSAELRPGQADTDSLPPYEMLDPILAAYIEADRSPSDIVAEGFDRAVVEQVVRLVDRAEYKRRQAAPGVKITRRAFGKDRRLPISQSWTGSRGGSS